MRRGRRCCWSPSIAATCRGSGAWDRRRPRSRHGFARHAPDRDGLPRMTPLRAVILAAGQGIRLRSMIEDRPKGLIEIGGETLLARSLRLLHEAGVTDITIVAGHLAGHYA